jgi:tetratricopeptide (TPR) repeat protein
MAMITNPKYLALLMMLVATGNTVAQQDDSVEPADETGLDLADDYVGQGQVVPVAEEGVAEEAAEDDQMTVPELDDNERLLAEFELFKQLMNDNVLDEADTVAKRVVELAIEAHGPRSNEYAKALTNLAIVQSQTEQYDAAIQNFETAIEIIEDNEDRLNAQLVNPLKGLGAAQLEYGRPDLASETFQRAIHVTHVNEGPHNLEQIELLESIAETYVIMGELSAAKETQDMIYALNIREHELNAIAMVPSLRRRAEWQHRAGFILDERATYRRIIRIIEESKGKESIDLVQPLILLGRSYFYRDTTGPSTFSESAVASGEIYFRRALRIASERPDPSWEIIAQASLALADYYTYIGNSQRADQAYSETWELLSQGDEQLEVRREQLEQVIALQQNQLPRYVESEEERVVAGRDEASLQGSVTFSYDVSKRGRVGNVILVDARPPEFERMVSRVQRELRRRVFRPRMVDGETVDTPDLTLEHKFFYRQSDLDALRATKESEEIKEKEED